MHHFVSLFHFDTIFYDIHSQINCLLQKFVWMHVRVREINLHFPTQSLAKLPVSVRGLHRLRGNWIAGPTDRKIHNGMGSPWEYSPAGSRFSKTSVRHVPGTIPENVRTCGFMINSSSLDRASKLRHSVLLKSWDGFLVTLFSISSGICVVYSSKIPGTDMLCDRLLLWFSGVTLETAAKFRFFL